MSNIVKHEAGTLPALQMNEAELMKVLQSSLYPGANTESIKMVLGYCRASGLDPMQKPVHIVPMWDNKAKAMRDVVMPGIGLYRTQAARSGCAGVSEPDFGPDVTEQVGGVQITYPSWCRVSVKRRLATGEVVEFTAKEFWKENYATAGKDSTAPNAMWKKRPFGQLAKCAEAQALRKAFPEIGSEPTADEMAGKSLNEYDGTTIDAATGEITPARRGAATEPVERAPYPADKFTANLPAWSKVIQSGRKSAEDIIAMASSVAPLTDAQKAEIRAIGQPATKEQAGPNADAIRAKLTGATTLDELYEAADLIDSIQDNAHQLVLTDIFTARQAELEQA